MADELDYYAVLEVSPDADIAAIRNAYRRLARLYHPDVVETGSVERMQQLNAAYQVLSDPERRRVYDAQRLAARRPAWDLTRDAVPERARPAPQPERPRAGSVHSGSGPLHRIASLEARDATPAAALAFAHDGARVGIGLLDGRVQIWQVPEARLVTTLAFGSGSSAGVLQELRLSAGGTIAAAWGFQLGLRVWQVSDGRTLWYASTTAPTGTMDAILYDDPPLIRLALPDAPLAKADNDPFRWAHEGLRGSSVLSRPLRGPIDPAWAVPLRSIETGSSGSLFPHPTDDSWRVHLRMLSASGRLLFTFSSGATTKLSQARALAVWELDHRTLLGVSQPRRVARVVEPAEYLRFPVAVTPDLSWAAAGYSGTAMRLISPRTGPGPTIPTGPVADDALIALAADGRYLALARDDRLELWQTRGGRRVQDWRFGAEISALTFGGSGERPILGVALRNGIAELWGV